MHHAVAIFLMVLTSTSVFAWQDSDTTVLPVVHIQTDGSGIGDTGVIARFGISDGGRSTRFDAAWNSYDGWADVNLHGNSSSWFEKKSMAVELVDVGGKEAKSGLLGMSKESDWILVANYSDKSLVRNAFGYAMAARTGRYSPRNRLVELVVDGDYQGVYLLTERVKRDSLRVDVSKLDVDDNQGDSLTGGYILRIDRFDENAGWTSALDGRVKWECYYPKPSKITAPQKSYIRDFVSRFESLMASPGYAHPDTGYSRWIAAGSFRDYLLHTEWVRNIDGYRLSSFLYKERDAKGGRLHAGPVWDLDLCCGLPNYYDGWKTDGWVYEWDAYAVDDGSAIPFWWKTLARDPDFHKQLGCRWKELRQGPWSDKSWEAALDSLVGQVAGAQERNFRKWEVLSSPIWPVAYVPGTWTGEVDTLRNWLGTRLKWMDDQFSKTNCVAASNPSGNPTSPGVDFTLRDGHLRWNAMPVRAAISDLRGSKIQIDPSTSSKDLSWLDPGVWIISWTDFDGSVKARKVLIRR